MVGISGSRRRTSTRGVRSKSNVRRHITLATKNRHSRRHGQRPFTLQFRHHDGNSSQRQRLVLVTVPHSFCLPAVDYRTCDLAAARAANLLGNEILAQSRGGLKPVLFVNSTVLRASCDLNRERCPQVGFRTQLSQFAVTNWNNIEMCIDIHSFPDEYSDWTGNDMVILDELGPVNMQRASVSLLTHCLSYGLQVSLYGGKDNSIVRELLTLGKRLQKRIPCLLLEFNESHDETRLRHVTSVVAQWIVRYVASAQNVRVY